MGRGRLKDDQNGSEKNDELNGCSEERRRGRERREGKGNGKTTIELDSGGAERGRLRVRHRFFCGAFLACFSEFSGFQRGLARAGKWRKRMRA